jgi:hypothetical protein
MLLRVLDDRAQRSLSIGEINAQRDMPVVGQRFRQVDANDDL